MESSCEGDVKCRHGETCAAVPGHNAEEGEVVGVGNVRIAANRNAALHPQHVMDKLCEHRHLELSERMAVGLWRPLKEAHPSG